VTPSGCRLTDHCAEAARIPYYRAFRALSYCRPTKQFGAFKACTKKR
jgi:hypothetical protein